MMPDPNSTKPIQPPNCSGVQIVVTRQHWRGPDAGRGVGHHDSDLSEKERPQQSAALPQGTQRGADTSRWHCQLHWRVGSGNNNSRSVMHEAGARRTPNARCATALGPAAVAPALAK